MCMAVALSACSREPATSAESTAHTSVPLQDPSEDNELNILLLGNSYSYYWPDELWGMMNAAGYENVTICNIYYGGCTFEKHWTWHTADVANYQFITNDASGRHTEDNWNLDRCISRKNWDVISLQQSNGYMYNGGEDAQLASMEPYLGNLMDLLKSRFPDATYYWLQSWAHDVGYGVDDIPHQQQITEAFGNVARKICQQYNLINVPCGDAWGLIRQDPLILEGGKSLTTRIKGDDPMYDDLTHDGDHGGGQYLNACVWFEVLTRKSCIGNAFRPQYTYKEQDYSLSEEKIALLQNAAHTAVANYHGEDYAK